VTGGIADGQKYRFVLRPRFVKRLVTPWVPVDGVVGVLEEIGGFFVDEFICMLFGGHENHSKCSLTYLSCPFTKIVYDGKISIYQQKGN
jgi:hypothetical protein